MSDQKFPDADHAAKVCLLHSGVATCRYIVLVGGNITTGYQYSCEKKSPLKSACDRDAGHHGAGLGDNCEGLDWR